MATSRLQRDQQEDEVIAEELGSRVEVALPTETRPPNQREPTLPSLQQYEEEQDAGEAARRCYGKHCFTVQAARGGASGWGPQRNRCVAWRVCQYANQNLRRISERPGIGNCMDTVVVESQGMKCMATSHPLEMLRKTNFTAGRLACRCTC